MAGKLSSAVWQYPYVNLFKTFDLQKVGDVKLIMDREVKASVYSLSGAIVASNYIVLPHPPHPSLQLKGRFVYFLIKPKPGKYFTVHLDVATEVGLVVRVSFSNLYKDFKCTSTWLRIPFQYKKKENLTWCILALDLQVTLAQFVSRSYAFVKNIKICGNVFVKSIFTSNTRYSQFGSMPSSGQYPFPRDISFHVPKGLAFADLYSFLQFPKPLEEPSSASVSHFAGAFQQVSSSSSTAAALDRAVPRQWPNASRSDPAIVTVGGVGPSVVRRSLSANHPRSTVSQPPTNPPSQPLGAASRSGRQRVDRALPRQSEEQPANLARRIAHKGRAGLKEEEGEEGSGCIALRPAALEPTVPNVVTVRSPSKKRAAGGRLGKENLSCGQPAERAPRVTRVVVTRHEEDVVKEDPVLELSRVLCHTASAGCPAELTEDGRELVYPSHCIAVAMTLADRRQRFFMGHANKVCVLSLCCGLLATGEAGSHPVIRLWDFPSERCLSLVKAHHSDLHCLKFSEDAARLVGVGKDGHSRTAVVVWSTAALRSTSGGGGGGGGGEVRVAGKAHTDIDISKIKFAPSDHTRMASCGWDNIRLWRLKDGCLKSCPVDLGSHHQLHFTDLTFHSGPHSQGLTQDTCILVCSGGGLVVEVHYQSVSVRRVWRLAPGGSPSEGLTAIQAHEQFCVTGGADGSLRVWPLQFSSVLLERSHDSAITSLQVSRDGLSIVASTQSGGVGVLDASSREHRALLHSHQGPVLCAAATPDGRLLVTAGNDDGTLRVWRLESGEQTLQFETHRHDDRPTALACHPASSSVACGFSSGCVRVFHLLSAQLLAEQKCLRSAVTHCAYSSHSSAAAVLYVSTAEGALALFDSGSGGGGGRDSEAGHAHSLLSLHRGLLSPTTASSSTSSAAAALLRPFAVCELRGRLAVLGPSPHTFAVLDLEDMQEVLRVDTTRMDPGPRGDPVGSGCLVAVAFQPPHHSVLMLQTEGGALMFFDLLSGRMTREVRDWGSGGRSEARSCLCPAPSGHHLLCSSGRMVQVWRAASNGTLVDPQVYLGHCAPVRQVLMVSCCSTVVSLAGSILVWRFQDSFADRPEDSAVPRFSPRSPVPYCRPLPTALPTATPSIATAGRHGNDDDSMCRDQPPPISSVGPPSDSSSGSDDDSSSGSAEDSSTGGSTAEGRQGWRGGSDSTPPGGRGLSPDGGGEDSVAADPPNPSGPHREHAYRLAHIAGSEPSARNNLVWHPLLGLLVYSCGGVLVLERLSTSERHFITAHAPSTITALTIQHSGDVVATSAGSSDSGGRGGPGEVRLWSLQTLRLSGRVLREHGGGVVSLDFSRDDRFLLAAGHSSMTVWSSGNYQALASSAAGPEGEGERGTVRALWNPFAANTFCSVGTGPHLAFWTVSDRRGPKQALEAHYCEVSAGLKMHNGRAVVFTSLAFDSSSKLFVSTSTGRVLVWNWSSRQCLFHWSCSDKGISLILSGRGRVITGGRGGTLALWSAEDVDQCGGMRAVSEGELQVKGDITAGSFDTELKMGVVSSALGSLHYINWDSSSAVMIVCGPSSQVVSMATDEGVVATTCADGTVSLWSVPSMDLLQSYHTPNSGCGAVCVFAGGRSAAVGYSSGCVRLFDARRARQTAKMAPHSCPVTAVGVPPSGKVVLSGSQAGQVSVTDLGSGICLYLISDHAGCPVTALQNSAHHLNLPSSGSQPINVWMISGQDGRHSVWGSRWAENVHVLLDWISLPNTKGSLARLSPVHADTVLVTCTSPAHSSGVQFYSLSQHKVVESCWLQVGPVTALALSPDGKELTAGGAGQLEVINLETGSSDVIPTGSGAISHLSYSSPDQILSSSSSLLCAWNRNRTGNGYGNEPTL